MAANLQLLQRRIKTAKNISQISKAMEMISASKIKKAQEAVESNRPYSSRIETLTQKLLQSMSEKKKYSNPYIDEKKGDTPLLIVISPDKGLCGSLNTNIYKKLASHNLSGGKIIAVGKRAELASVRLKLDLLASFPVGTSLPSYSIVNALRDLIDEQYIDGEVSKVEILYASFESFFSQKPIIDQLLPIKKETAEEGATTQQLVYTFEPDAQKILDQLLPTYMEVLIYRALIEAYTSEQAARMMAMQNAKNNANEIAEYLTLSYNKSRQEKITGEILDLANNQ